MAYNVSKNLTLDVELSKTEEYKTCLEAIEYLRLSGIIEHAAGNCIAMCDLMQHTLQEFGISSRIVECKLVMSRKENGKVVEFRYIGFNGTSVNTEYIDTHVVIVTETAIPMLIDLSISHMLLNGRTWIVERVKSDDKKVVSTIEFPECNITYSYKKSIRLLGLHQNNLLDRLNVETETKNKISLIQRILIVLGTIAVINFGLNTTMLYVKFNVTAPAVQEIRNEVIR